MNPKVIFSINTQCLNNPEFMGLTKDDLNSNNWLKVYTNAQTCRTYIQQNKTIPEVWILSNDDIEAINLAAAIKKDSLDTVVCLISFDLTGSLQSRASAAKIDVVLSIDSFKERYYVYKKKYSEQSNLSFTTKTDKPTSNKDKNNVVINKVPKLNYSNDKNKKAFVFPILSASGGAGKSSISVLCAIMSQIIGHRTILIDCDWQFGDCVVLSGVKKAVSVDELIKNNKLFSQLKPNGNLPCVLAPPVFPELAEELLDSFPGVLHDICKLFDVVVLNTGSFWGELQAVLLENDNKSLFVVDQRPTSVNASKRALSMCERCGIATNSVLYAINRCTKNSLFTSIDISCAMKGAPVAEILDGGLEVDECFAMGNPQLLISTRNPFAVSLWSVVQTILPKSKIEDKLQILKNGKRNYKKSIFKKKNNPKARHLFSKQME